MRNRINFLIVIIMILSLFGCKKTSEIEILGVYAVDKQPVEFSNDNKYYYLILDKNNVYYLKSYNTKKESIIGSWEIMSSKNDTLNVKFNFLDQFVMGKLKGHTFLFESPNVFDKRLPASLYVKTNLESSKIINPAARSVP